MRYLLWPVRAIEPATELMFVAMLLAVSALAIRLRAAAQMNQAVHAGIRSKPEKDVRAFNSAHAIDVLGCNIAGPLIRIVIGVDHR